VSIIVLDANDDETPGIPLLPMPVVPMPFPSMPFAPVEIPAGRACIPDAPVEYLVVPAIVDEIEPEVDDNNPIVVDGESKLVGVNSLSLKTIPS
jgi:hypothetical protein